jgi:hypothetical protein
MATLFPLRYPIYFSVCSAPVFIAMLEALLVGAVSFAVLQAAERMTVNRNSRNFILVIYFKYSTNMEGMMYCNFRHLRYRSNLTNFASSSEQCILENLVALSIFQKHLEPAPLHECD